MRVSRQTTTGLAAGCVALAALTGCQTVKDNPRATGTVAGAGVGALAGSAIAGKGHKTEGALIGGAVGAGGGWLAADQIDKNNNKNDDEAARRRARAREDATYDSRGSTYDRF